MEINNKAKKQLQSEAPKGVICQKCGQHPKRPRGFSELYSLEPLVLDNRRPYVMERSPKSCCSRIIDIILVGTSIFLFIVMIYLSFLFFNDKS